VSTDYPCTSAIHSTIETVIRSAEVNPTLGASVVSGSFSPYRCNAPLGSRGFWAIQFHRS
jgi:hypothetical protein